MWPSQTVPQTNFTFYTTFNKTLFFNHISLKKILIKATFFIYYKNTFICLRDSYRLACGPLHTRSEEQTMQGVINVVRKQIDLMTKSGLNQAFVPYNYETIFNFLKVT